MSIRHLSRSVAMQSLFERDFSSAQGKDIDEILSRNVKEFAPGSKDEVFIKNLAKGVVKKQETLDKVISKAAPDWPLEKISAVDRNVLRLGLYELLFGGEAKVPPKVAINEAIELAKTFGGDNSGRFVNGVLGAVYREMGEPDKNQEANKKAETDPKKMPIEKKGGAVVFSEHQGEYYLALVHDVFGYWTLSKGGIDQNKEENEAVAEKVKSEIGIDVSVKEKIGENEYVASHPEKGKIRKQVSYFLAEATYQPLVLGESGGLDDVKWFKLNDVSELNIYDDILPIITEAIKKINKG